MKRINYWLLAIMLIAFISCNEDKTDPNGKGEVVLSVSQSLKSSIKNDSDYKMTSVKKAVVTLKKDGVVLADYNQAEIAVYNMSGEYFTKKLLLLNGQYSVDEFYLVDENNTTLFATPLEGSKQAQNVSTPLPLVFNVETDKSASVNIEVLSTENLSPTDFGLSSLHISEVKTIPFFINVSELGKKELLEAEVVVKSGDYAFTDTTKSIVNNPIIVKKGFGNYTVIVKKDGFQKFEKIYTAEELIGFKENPLVVELERYYLEDGLVAYYKFDNDIKDYSGFNNHGEFLTQNYNFINGGAVNSCINLFPNKREPVITVSDSDILDCDEEVSFSVWVKPIFNNDGNANVIVGQWDTSPVNGDYEIRIMDKEDDHRIIMGFSNQVGGFQQEFLYSSAHIKNDIWQHIVITFNKGVVKCYIDGALDSEQTSKIKYLNTTEYDNDVIYIGNHPKAYHYYEFTGKMDELRMYNKEISQSKVSEILNKK